MPDFVKTNIDVRYFTDLWGVYTFQFSDALPTGSSLATVSVRAFVGNVTPSSTLASETEIADLIDPAFAPATADHTKVQIKFQYPLVVDHKGDRATLIFQLSLVGGAQHPFYFQYVSIR